MRVNYQGLLNQTLGAVGSTMSTLKFLHSQDPKVIKEREIETQKETDARRAEEARKEIEKNDRDLTKKIDAKYKEIGSIEKKITKDSDYDRFDEPITNPRATYLRADSSDHNYTENKPTLENLYADIMQLSDARYNINPTDKNLESAISEQRTGRANQASLQDKAENDMVRSLIRKMITTNDQEESYRARKELLGRKGVKIDG